MEAHLEQRSESWKKWRKSHLGSSDCAAIMGVSPWKSALQLYHEKTSDTIEESVSNFAMRRGVELEPLALAKFEAETGYLMTPRVLVHPVHTMLSASLDGLEIEQKCAVEIKCSGKVDHALALKGEVPEKYIPQLHHIMLVTGLSFIYYMSYVSDEDFTIFKVFRDYEYEKRLITAELEFWNRIQERNPPQPTDRDSEEITCPEWENLSDQFSVLHALEKEHKFELERIESLKDEIKNELVKLSDNRSAYGAGIKLSKVVRRGHIDYAAVPNLVGIDLEPFRKPSTEYWKISFEGEKE